MPQLTVRLCWVYPALRAPELGMGMKMLQRLAGNAMLTGMRICVLSSIPGTRSSARTWKKGSERVILGGRHTVPHEPGLHSDLRAATDAG